MLFPLSLASKSPKIHHSHILPGLFLLPPRPRHLPVASLNSKNLSASSSHTPRQQSQPPSAVDDQTPPPSPPAAGETTASSSSSPPRFALPAPGVDDDSSNSKVPLPVGGRSVKLADLGPLVMDKNGTVSRIANWTELTSSEKNIAMIVLDKRNRGRREALQGKLNSMSKNVSDNSS
ncbi:hypothetical protein L249_2320 [Ophiocordyceps polyrhachis-furcata BCC 54312]|uniref:Uncharacterized protein n=1 Tax=Ophiocordyceps polyrhachis-furcata BCC 54312 TaxID=1330021 RepID=A0A367LRG9_9HYPO|nr:hypothetical protein L249_2320 [Ophiocordyceps polyrhachis-furcata BCC 54312]